MWVFAIMVASRIKEKDKGDNMAYADSWHIVLDIETLGIETGAPIIQIAAKILKHKDGVPVIVYDFNRYINLQSNIDAGLRTLDEDTLLWWLDQYKNHNSDTLEQAVSGDALDDVLYDFAEFIRDCVPADADKFFWSRGIDFDFRHLAHAFEVFDIRVPWKFWECRDLRTIDDKAFLGDFVKDKNNHDARTDTLNDLTLLSWAIWKQRPVVSGSIDAPDKFC